MIKQWHIQVLLGICIIFAFVLLVRRSDDGALTAGPAVQAGPLTPATKPIITAPTEALLDHYQKLLAEKAPKLLAALQPGLTAQEVTALETKYSTKLAPELRALYRWHNGIPSNTLLNGFPNHSFPPLDEVFAERVAVQAQIKKTTTLQRLAIAAFVGQRSNWLAILPDGAGDGYFYDPSRPAAQGTFFYSMAEDPAAGVCYRSFREYLAEILEGYEAGIYCFGANGAETADFRGMAKLKLRYGAQEK